MKRFELDCGRMTDRFSVHAYLRKALNLPDYYGNNLDALYDCLQEFPDCTVVLRRVSLLEEAEGYGRALLQVFRDVADELPSFRLLEEDGPEPLFPEETSEGEENSLF